MTLLLQASCEVLSENIDPPPPRDQPVDDIRSPLSPLKDGRMERPLPGAPQRHRIVVEGCRSCVF